MEWSIFIPASGFAAFGLIYSWEISCLYEIILFEENISLSINNYLFFDSRITFFTFLSHGIFCYKTVRVILIFGPLFVLTAVYKFLCTVYLSLAYLSLIGLLLSSGLCRRLHHRIRLHPVRLCCMFSYFRWYAILQDQGRTLLSIRAAVLRTESW